MYRVLEVKHHVPYDGCFWRWNYFLVDIEVDEVVEVTPIIWYAERPSFAHTMGEERATWFWRNWENELLGGDDEDTGYFDTASFFPLDDTLWDEIPTNDIPAFWQFFNGDGPGAGGYTFRWKCDYCDKLTAGQPTEMTGYTGNGGIGIEADGWVEEDCEWASKFETVVSEAAWFLRYRYAEVDEVDEIIDAMSDEKVEKLAAAAVRIIEERTGDIDSATDQEKLRVILDELLATREFE